MWASHFEDLVSAAEDKKGYDNDGRNSACVEAERRFCETLDELQQSLQEVVEMLLEDDSPDVTAEFVGTQQIVVA